MYWSPPKVVEEDIRDRSLRSQVSVFFYGTDVVKDEATVKAVVVNDYTREDEDCT